MHRHWKIEMLAVHAIKRIYMEYINRKVLLWLGQRS